MDETNSKYFIASIAIAVLFIIAGALGLFYFIVFIHDNSTAYQITSLLLAALGVYFLYNRLKRRKQRISQNV
jgi:putative Mn2+ efflux pump MntP